MRKAHGQKITDRGYRCNSDRLITYEKGRQSERYGVWLPAAKDFTSNPRLGGLMNHQLAPGRQLAIAPRSLARVRSAPNGLSHSR